MNFDRCTNKFSLFLPPAALKFIARAVGARVRVKVF